MEKERILKEAHPLIVASINKYAKDKDEFEDLYQEGAMRVLELLEKFDESRGVSIFYYLKLHLKFFYLNYGRYDKKTVSLNTPVFEGSELGDLIMDEKPGVEKTVLDSLARENANKALKSLPGEDKYIIEELFIRCRTLNDLAKELAISRTSLFRRKEKILRHLKKQM